MEKEMEKENNSEIIEVYYLKGFILKERDGMEKDAEKIIILFLI